MLFINHSNLFTILADILPAAPTISRGGAFNGKDTLQLAKHFPHATINALSPSLRFMQNYKEIPKQRPPLKSIRLHSAIGQVLPLFMWLITLNGRVKYAKQAHCLLLRNVWLIHQLFTLALLRYLLLLSMIGQSKENARNRLYVA